MFLIEKSCAGINFMIAAFAMLVFVAWQRVVSGLSAVRVVTASLAAAYVAAVAVNATRIAIAMVLAAKPDVLPTFGAADLHRIEGVVVYFGGLVLLHEAARRVKAAP
jgi:exosortase K